MNHHLISRLSTYFLVILSMTGLACVAIDGGSDASDSSSASETDETEYNEPSSLSTDDDGGYTTEDEDTAFGLETMEQYAEDDEGEEDATVTSEEETEAEEEADAEVYLVRIVWGNLELNPRHEFTDRRDEDEAVALLNWNGTLSYDGDSTFLLKRTILFEGRDRIVEDEDRELIEWVSHTGPHIDGILAKLIVTPGTDTDVLTFATDDVTQEIALADLDHYNEIVTLDEDGHGVAFTALKINDNPDGCTEGFLEGKFHARPDGEEGGMFRGRVLAESGILNGHIRGHYGERDEEEVFFGKYISNTGLFRGLLRGTSGDGAFEGDWIADDGELQGTLNGKYVAGDDVDSGFFQGFWEEGCEP